MYMLALAQMCTRTKNRANLIKNSEFSKFLTKISDFSSFYNVFSAFIGKLMHAWPRIV